MGNFEDCAAGMADELDCDINHSAPQSGGKGRGLNLRSIHILLEGLKGEEGKEDRIVEGRILSKLEMGRKKCPVLNFFLEDSLTEGSVVL